MTAMNMMVFVSMFCVTFNFFLSRALEVTVACWYAAYRFIHPSTPSLQLAPGYSDFALIKIVCLLKTSFLQTLKPNVMLVTMAACVCYVDMFPSALHELVYVILSFLI